MTACSHFNIHTETTYRVAQKSKPLPNDKNRIKSYKSLPMRIDLFEKLKYESSTIILFVGIRYSMRELLSHLNNYAWPANYSDMRQIRKWCQRFLWHQLAIASCEFYV